MTDQPRWPDMDPRPPHGGEPGPDRRSARRAPGRGPQPRDAWSPPPNPAPGSSGPDGRQPPRDRGSAQPDPGPYRPDPSWPGGSPALPPNGTIRRPGRDQDRPETGRRGSGQRGPGQREIGGREPGAPDPNRPGAGPRQPGRPDWQPPEPGRPGAGRREQGRREQGQAGPGRTGQGQSGAGRRDPGPVGERPAEPTRDDLRLVGPDEPAGPAAPADGGRLAARRQREAAQPAPRPSRRWGGLSGWYGTLIVFTAAVIGTATTSTAMARISLPSRCGWTSRCNGQLLPSG